MKTRLVRKTKQLASALLTTLVICSILAIFVLYYLSLVDQQSYLNCRSQTWNMAIAISEAGVEEGMAQLNLNFPDMNSDGWTYNGSTYYWKSNSLPGGNGYLSYIYITNSAFPAVVSRAFVTMPVKYAQRQSTAFLAAINTGFSSPGTNSAPVTRAVSVTATRRTPFQYAMVAKNNIDLQGKNVVTDSFDSSDPNKSTNGQYDPTKRGSRGDIATNLGVLDSINGGNATVYGHAHTGPGSQSTALQIGSLGYVGNALDQATVGSGNVDPGYWLPDSNFSFPTTSYPNTSGYQTTIPSGYLMVSSNWSVSYITNVATLPSPLPPGGVTPICGSLLSSPIPPLVPCCLIQTNNNNGVKQYVYKPITGYSYTFTNSYTTIYTNQYDNILYGNGASSLTSVNPLAPNSASNPYVLTSGVTGQTNYYVTSSSLSGNTYVAGSNVVLAIANGINMNGNDSLTVGQNANIIVYSGGTSASISGNGVVNQAGYAADFVLYAAPTVTSFSFVGNGAFIGCLVAPNAAVSMNGGGNSGSFTGCCIANSVTMTGNTAFHYDESLAGNNRIGRFLIISWNEVK